MPLQSGLVGSTVFIHQYVGPKNNDSLFFGKTSYVLYRVKSVKYDGLCSYIDGISNHQMPNHLSYSSSPNNSLLLLAVIENHLATVLKNLLMTFMGINYKSKLKVKYV